MQVAEECLDLIRLRTLQACQVLVRVPLGGTGATLDVPVRDPIDPREVLQAVVAAAKDVESRSDASYVQWFFDQVSIIAQWWTDDAQMLDDYARWRKTWMEKT